MGGTMAGSGGGATGGTSTSDAGAGGSPDPGCARSGGGGETSAITNRNRHVGSPCDRHLCRSSDARELHAQDAHRPPRRAQHPRLGSGVQLGGMVCPEVCTGQRPHMGYSDLGHQWCARVYQGGGLQGAAAGRNVRRLAWRAAAAPRGACASPGARADCAAFADVAHFSRDFLAYRRGAWPH